MEKEKFKELPLQTPLVNISSLDDLRLASIKVDDVQNLIQEQELKHDETFYKIATSWGTTLGVISLIAIRICCSCCCCKCCQDCVFWFWNKISPRECWRETQDKCSVSIYNYNGSRVEYQKTNISPAISIKSLPEIGNVITESPKRTPNKTFKVDDETGCISKRLRSKKMFH
jgi:hypothetical protein